MAILFVLLFHIREDVFKVGYLGVDIFFVISGYLMCMLMSRKLPLNWQKVSDFYFRRLKRIVPVYLFVIFCVHSSAILLFFSAFDYEVLYDESIKPLFFAANIPENELTNYFTQVHCFLINYDTFRAWVRTNFFFIYGLLVLKFNFTFSYL